ncbi:MAG: hypothetical protein GQ574_05415 [Crocinitomix sp.]|nr:hypothetical protein [Crocinitomix sp.]
MKKIILAGLVLGLSFGSFSQEVEKTNQKPERIKLVTGGESKSTVTTTEVKKTQTPAQELESCETQLSALNKKEVYIRGNAEELKLANENGWFKNAEKTRAVLVKRIAELKLELKK